MKQRLAQRPDLTFKANIQHGRHSWLRLTPAFSAQLVEAALERAKNKGRALDPFCGTGTTGLVCAEHGIACDLVEVNPFLVWLSRAKTREYTAESLHLARQLALHAVNTVKNSKTDHTLWLPPIHQIDRWWSPLRQRVLGSLFAALHSETFGDESARDLNLIAFCRVAIEWSGAAFNHQSLSFKTHNPSLFEPDEERLILEHFVEELYHVLSTCTSPIGTPVRVFEGDSRYIHHIVPDKYDLVITSPPYPNRISYVRELRPYMYWLGYLKQAREAGELDWRTIGGTWGVATSRLAQWQPESIGLFSSLLEPVVSKIAAHSTILANYVLRYFHDMNLHLQHIRHVLLPGASLFYIVGNAKFYDTLVPTHEILADMMRGLGFYNLSCEPLRKRNSKKELFEYMVSAEWRTP